MIALSWNCRGLGNRRAVEVLAELVRQKVPTILFLMETKLTAREMEPIKKALGFPSMLAVSSDNRRWGLALLWKADVVVDTQTYSPNHIDVRVHTKAALEWRLTGIYGHPEDQRKSETWRLMRHLHARASLPWVCIGDFNEILASEEKNGRIRRPMAPMLEFRHTLLHCGLVDLGFNGYRFTWRNGRDGEAFVEERLDRAVATTDWCEKFPRAKVHHLSASYSDHDPILVDMVPSNNPADGDLKSSGLRRDG
ncbi:uncharacterized protein LOC142635056 [Castanea sativa]|uniref:uncharacterized protein LOC142635056 n=1 Tax=Castanea sativa TaxID=21020 RepID=UPI003F64C162